VDLSNKTILIISPECWGVNHLSKHHYALELAWYGSLVFFLEPPANKNELLVVSEKLKVVKYKRRFKGINRLPNWLRIPLMKIELSAVLKLIGVPIDIVWSFDPYRFQDLDLFKVGYRIFHSVDLLSSRWDMYTAMKADLVLTSNGIILDRYRDVNRPKYNIGHGLSRYFLEPEHLAPLQSFKRSLNRVAIGYCGNLLMQYLDLKTFTHIILGNPELDFYLIGPYQESNLSQSVSQEANEFINMLKKQDNCFLLGPKPPEVLYQYLVQMDILLICYQTQNYLNEVSDSHKTLEYLSTGKVVVSSHLLAYESKGHLIEMTNHNNQLGVLLSKVAKNLDSFNSEENMDTRIGYARERSYGEKIKVIERLIPND
jgi:hypothetical protein